MFIEIPNRKAIVRFLTINFAVWIAIFPIMTIVNLFILNFSIEQYIRWLEIGFFANLAYSYPVAIASLKAQEYGKKKNWW
jgi:hypothetical protein